MLVNAAERRDAQGRHLFTRLTVFNATDRRRYERELVDARAALQASLLDERATSALREQFIAVLSHDLRNPLSATTGGAELLMKTPMNDRGQVMVRLIQGSAARMGGLIDDVMDFARGRLGGGLTLERVPDASIEALLRQVVGELQTSAPQRTIASEFAIDAAVDCDPRRVGQLASNLLGNAITYGAPDKPIRFGAFTANGQFELFIANAGDPVPPPALEKISSLSSAARFAPASRVSGSASISQARSQKSTAARSMFCRRLPKPASRSGCRLRLFRTAWVQPRASFGNTCRRSED